MQVKQWALQSYRELKVLAAEPTQVTVAIMSE